MREAPILEMKEGLKRTASGLTISVVASIRPILRSLKILKALTKGAWQKHPQYPYRKILEMYAAGGAAWAITE